MPTLCRRFKVAAGVAVAVAVAVDVTAAAATALQTAELRNLLKFRKKSSALEVRKSCPLELSPQLYARGRLRCLLKKLKLLEMPAASCLVSIESRAFAFDKFQAQFQAGKLSVKLPVCSDVTVALGRHSGAVYLV